MKILYLLMILVPTLCLWGLMISGQEAMAMEALEHNMHRMLRELTPREHSKEVTCQPKVLMSIRLLLMIYLT
jgi:hypothetical protein